MEHTSADSYVFVVVVAGKPILRQVCCGFFSEPLDTNSRMSAVPSISFPVHDSVITPNIVCCIVWPCDSFVHKSEINIEHHLDMVINWAHPSCYRIGCWWLIMFRRKLMSLSIARKHDVTTAKVKVWLLILRLSFRTQGIRYSNKEC
jgi:hypothetical protein